MIFPPLYIPSLCWLLLFISLIKNHFWKTSVCAALPCIICIIIIVYSLHMALIVGNLIFWELTCVLYWTPYSVNKINTYEYSYMLKCATKAFANNVSTKQQEIYLRFKLRRYFPAIFHSTKSFRFKTRINVFY